MSTGPDATADALDEQVRSLLSRLRCLEGRAWSVSELGGGLTNRNYRVVTADHGPEQPGDYVVRISSNESSLLEIDRAGERYNTRAAWEAGVGAPVIEALPDANVLVVGFLQGRTLTADDVRDHASLPRIAGAVRQLHSGPAFQGRFDMRAIRRRYLAIVQERGFRVPAGYLDLAPLVEGLEEAMAPGAEPLVPCNNDLLAANLIDDGDRVWLIDYEYSGMNEASFELGNMASESALDLATTEVLVREYWQRPAPDKLARARAWALLAMYGWTLWASIQDGVSAIDFDFWGWGMEKYEAARGQLLGPVYADIVSGLAGAGA